MARFTSYCDSLPKDPAFISNALMELSSQSAFIDTTAVFILLQAGSFGGKAVWHTIDGKWVHHGFRSYWLPTATSNRRSPVNPMQPMPGTIIQRVTNLCETMYGVNAIYTDINRLHVPPDCVIYVDPPYGSTTGYGFCADIPTWALKNNLSCYVSEGCPLGPNALQLYAERDKGGITGKRDLKNAEWLTALGKVTFTSSDVKVITPPSVPAGQPIIAQRSSNKASILPGQVLLSDVERNE